MRVLLLGASGRCGQWFGRLGAARGHELTALLRSGAAHDAPAGVRVIRGDPLDADLVSDLVRGQDAVVSCLGIKRRNPLNPWSELASPADLTAGVTRTLIPAMDAAGVRRLLVISAAGVGDSAAVTNPIIRFLIRHSRVGASYRDLEEMETLLRASNLDWLAVRPVTLVGGSSTGRAQVISAFRTWSVVSRACVAAWMLDALERRDEYTDRTPLLGRA